MVGIAPYPVRMGHRRSQRFWTGWTLFLSLLPLSGCAVTAAPDVYSGYFRQGFEQSDFYTLDGEGPYWLSATGETYERLLDYLVQKDGRGSYITVRLTVRGELDHEGDYGLGYHESRLTVSEIIDIEAMDREEFDKIVTALHEARQSSESDGERD